MEIIVCKFGGTSAASADSFRRIRRILAEDPRRRYVVLSAPGTLSGEPKVTDLLVQGRTHEAVQRFEVIGAGLGLAGAGDRAREVLEEARRVSPARAVSRGEMLCAELFSRYSGMPWADAEGLICFDAGGRLSVHETLARLHAMAQKTPRAVLPGFYGTDPAGRTVLFPRNGSDITGALVAAGVGAALYENWTDVPGLMTADPATHPDARVISEISYADMRRMAEGGANVLHPDCLSPVEAAGIPTRLKYTLDPAAPGTLIH